MRIFIVFLMASLPTLVPRSAVAQLDRCAGGECPKGPGAPAPRAVLIDAVVLTPALEKSNARLGIEQAVMTTLREHGWEPVSVTSDCKDLGCAASVAAAAKAPYAVVLSGRFVKGETYAPDVGVSLWRDGTVVASRNESDEEAELEKAGAGQAAFLRCGPPSGACTAKLLTTKLQQYAAKLVGDESVAIRARLAAAAAAPVPPVPAVQTIDSVPPPAITEAPAHSKAIGWSLVIVGSAAIVGGAALWAANNTGVDCHGVAGDTDSCRGQLQTHTAALVTGLTGLAALGAGVIVLGWGPDSGKVALAVQGNGIIVGGRF